MNKYALSSILILSTLLTACGGGGGGGGGGGSSPAPAEPTSQENIAEDIAGNADGVAVSHDDLDDYIGMSWYTREGVDYTEALKNGSYADASAPTANEVRDALDAHNEALSKAAIVEDIAGNADGNAASSSDLSEFVSSVKILDGVNYATALANGSYVNNNNPTDAEIEAAIDAANKPAIVAALVEDIAGNADGEYISEDFLDAYTDKPILTTFFEDYGPFISQQRHYADATAPTVAEVTAAIEAFDAFKDENDSVLDEINTSTYINEATPENWLSYLNSYAGYNLGAAYTEDTSLPLVFDAEAVNDQHYNYNGNADDLDDGGIFTVVPDLSSVYSYIQKQNNIGHKKTTNILMDYYYYWDTAVSTDWPEMVFDEEKGIYDALEDFRHDDDRDWSYVTSAQVYSDYFDEGKYFSTGYKAQFNTDGDYKITVVYADSPADLAGLKRGDTITSIEGETITGTDFFSTHPDILYPDDDELTVLLADGSEKTLIKGDVTVKMILANTEFPGPSDKKVAYIMVDTFLSSNTELTEFFANYADKDAYEAVIVDLRTNSGGRIATANTLASLLRKPASTEELFVKMKSHNFNNRSEVEWYDLAFQEQAEALTGTDTKFYFLTSSQTASASELVINGLKPFADVYVIGEKSYGKDYASTPFTFFDESIILSLVTDRLYNGEAEGEYSEGIPTTCGAVDDISFAFGDVGDPLLAEAIHHLETGTCSATDASLQGSSLRHLAQFKQQQEQAREANHSIPFKGLGKEVGAY